MYLQETYISDEEALDIVLEYLWNEYDYETEEELYEAYDFLTDEEFEDILNENIFRDAGGAVIDAVKGAIKTGAKSFRERRAISNFNNAVKKKKNRKPDNVGQHSVQQTPNIADRVAPKASKQKATSSVVPVKFGNKVGTKPGVRTMDTSTVVPVNRYAAERRGPAADAFNKRQLRKNRQEQPGPNTTPVSKLNKRQRREKTAELRGRRDTGKGRTVRPIPAGQTRKGRENPPESNNNIKKIETGKTYVKNNRRRRKRMTVVQRQEEERKRQERQKRMASSKLRSTSGKRATSSQVDLNKKDGEENGNNKGFNKYVKPPLSKAERRAKRNNRKAAEKEAKKTPIVQANQTPSNRSKDFKKLSPSAENWKLAARSRNIAKAAEEGRNYFWGAKKR